MSDVQYLNSLELHFDRLLTEEEWREVVEFARTCPYVKRLTAHALSLPQHGDVLAEKGKSL